MFTKELNREMNSVLKERNKLKSSLSKQSTGFSDSDEDEIQTTKCNLLFELILFILEILFRLFLKH